MRFRKRPKIIEAVAVCNILAGDKHPYWLTRSIKAGKVIISAHKVSVITTNQVKHLEGSGWIAWDTAQEMVYAISRRTMTEDYEPADCLPLQGEF